jgi:hypothetical protein
MGLGHARGRLRRRPILSLGEGGGEEPTGPLLPPKFAALQHGGSGWLSDSARRAIVAGPNGAPGYDLVMCGIGLGTSNVPANLDALRAINPDIVISQYVQVWETHCKGILAVALVSGTTYRFTLDSTAEGASSSASYGSVGATIQLRNFATSAFNGQKTITAISSTAGVGGRACFDINIGSNPSIQGADATASLGTCCLQSDTHVGRYLLAADGPAEGWWLRGTVGTVANRVKGSGVDVTQRAVNFHDTTTPNAAGHQYPRVKADYDVANLITPFQPTVGDPFVIWIDNWNWRQRAGGKWGSVEGGPVESTEYSSTDSGVESRNRDGLKTYADRLRVLMPGVKLIGNADGYTGAATGGINGQAGIRSLDFPEYGDDCLDGAFIEEIYGAGSTGAEDTTKIGSFYNDNWTKLQGRIREQRRMLADPGLHVIMVQGRGASNTIQQQDHQFFCIGLVATLMQGTTRALMSHCAFSPVTHDVTVNHVRFAERDWLAGDPVEDEQTAPRGWSGASTAWARAFQGGAAIGNASTTTSITITDAHLQTLPGYPFDFLESDYGTLNTGGPVGASFVLPAKSGVILKRRA